MRNEYHRRIVYILIILMTLSVGLIIGYSFAATSIIKFVSEMGAQYVSVDASELEHLIQIYRVKGGL